MSELIERITETAKSYADSTQLCSVLATPVEWQDMLDGIKQLHDIVEIGSQLAGHVTRSTALSMPFDRDVLRYCANKFHEHKRAAEKKGDDDE